MILQSSNPVCCVFGAGEYFNTEFTGCVPQNSFIIAADGGIDHLIEHNIKPELIVGDFDSATAFETYDSSEIIRLNPVKDDTDTLHAVNIAYERGYREFRFFGCTGGRSSHTIANIQLLHMLVERGARGYLFGNNEVLTAFSGALEFNSAAHGYISVFSLTDQSFGVCENGLKYSLHDYLLKSTDTIGVSNEFIGNSSIISSKSGVLLAVFGDISFIAK